MPAPADTPINSHGHASRLAMGLVAGALLVTLAWRLNHLPSVEPHPPRDPGFLVDVNRADADTLQLLPGLGPSIAQNVVTRRETAGPFERVEDLQDVRMIGEILQTRIAPWVTLGKPMGAVVALPLNPPLNPPGDAEDEARR